MSMVHAIEELMSMANQMVPPFATLLEALGFFASASSRVEPSSSAGGGRSRTYSTASLVGSCPTMLSTFWLSWPQNSLQCDSTIAYNFRVSCQPKCGCICCSLCNDTWLCLTHKHAMCLVCSCAIYRTLPLTQQMWGHAEYKATSSPVPHCPVHNAIFPHCHLDL